MSDDTVTVDQHWCLTEDRSRVVPETHQDARWLHWTPGQVVPRAEAERLGAVAPSVVAAPTTKQRVAPANKSRPRGE